MSVFIVMQQGWPVAVYLTFEAARAHADRIPGGNVCAMEVTE